MDDNLKPVTYLDAYNAYKQLQGTITKKNTSRLDIVTEILNLCNIDVLQQPVDEPFKESWRKKKEKICVAYASILENNRKRKKPGDSIFFHPSEDQIFAQYRKPASEKDLDFDCSNLNLDESDFDSESESYNESDQKQIGGPRKIIEIGKTRKENRNIN